MCELSGLAESIASLTIFGNEVNFEGRLGNELEENRDFCHQKEQRVLRTCI